MTVEVQRALPSSPEDTAFSLFARLNFSEQQQQNRLLKRIYFLYSWRFPCAGKENPIRHATVIAELESALAWQRTQRQKASLKLSTKHKVNRFLAGFRSNPPPMLSEVPQNVNSTGHFDHYDFDCVFNIVVQRLL